MSSPTIHTVKPGDTLEAIRKQYRMPSVDSIFNSPENKDFKARRKSADNIHPKDKIVIPEHPIEVINKKIDYLKKLEAESRATSQQLLREEDKRYKAIKHLFSSIDIVASIATAYVGIVNAGYKAMQKTGQELAKANQKLAVKAVTNGPNVAFNIAMSTNRLEATAEDGLVMALGKIGLQSWIDMQSPSFWVQKITGVNANEIHLRTKGMISRNQERTTALLNQRIQALEDERQRLSLDIVQP